MLDVVLEATQEIFGKLQGLVSILVVLDVVLEAGRYHKVEE